MELFFIVLGGIKIVQFFVCTAPEQAVKIKRMSNETGKKDSHGHAANRVFVEDVLLTVDDIRSMAACSNGCGDRVKRGAGLVPEVGPAMVAMGELCHCGKCGKYSSAA
jgi:hypothetical protein